MSSQKKFFVGIDRSTYPGDDMMRQLRTEANVAWTGFYLGPAPSHSDTSWMQKHLFLKQLGYGFAPVYVGQQQQESPGSHNLSASQAAIDAKDAVQLARQAGFPPTSVLYLDIETGPPPESELSEYYEGWVEGVKDGGFSPGVYCSHLLAPDLVDVGGVIVWIYQLKFSDGETFQLPLSSVDPTQSNFTSARMMQYAQNATLELSDDSLDPVDLNSSVIPDPSAG